MENKFKVLDAKELREITGGGIDVPMLNELAAGFCSFIDGFKKKKYRGKC